ncbi:flagellin N-terminal-like domain-containing protein [Halopelagius inordinatus]|uniref:Flagellin N-terminal-like domain-containing protein n=1 Tax=Halopelagius inordinatus TaxID=553467 RepID=A0A1I2NUU1_9EURY|nr:archaellin/type IV pilin N-terminal domain-containing protein [Halopelagius inordinatus]SFG05021.1 flagellin N-terminal-like domain-containing protein [Halopelagius inordinatus]
MNTTDRQSGTEHGIARTASTHPRGRFEADRAQSPTIAVVLLIGMVVTAAGLTVTLGATAIDGTTQTTELDRAEHAMTLFDARTAMVGLGETGGQSVTLGRASGGAYDASADTGRIRIVHTNYSGTHTEELYNRSLGEVTYTNGDTEIAYQGGGVWRHTDGGTTMVSPPEFHYRDATLTLPVIRVTSGDASGGPSRAFVTRDSETLRVYPNQSAEYEEVSRPYHNPVQNGTVSVEVQSTYYRGWADYFRERTTGRVTVDHSAQTATVVLETVGQVGDFALPSKGEGVELRGKAPGHSVNAFDVDIKQSGGSFNNMKFSFYAEQDGRMYEVLIRVDSDKGNCEKNKPDDTLTMWVLYDDPNDGKGKHAWVNDSIPIGSGPIRLECDGKDTRIVADYLSDETTLRMTDDPSLPSKTGLAWDDDTATEVSFNHSGYDGENKTHTTGGPDTETVGNLSRHYLTEMGSDYELKVYHGGGSSGTAHVDGSASSGSLFYDTSTGTRYITYLHVTENNVNVTFR